jgi:predicted  nucleic acid-binding Zn-ribbon protein
LLCRVNFTKLIQLFLQELRTSGGNRFFTDTAIKKMKPATLAFKTNPLYNLVMSQISILYRLQQIDTQLDNARSTLQSIEARLSDDSLVISAQGKLTELEQKHQVEQKQLRDAEMKSNDTHIKIEQSEASLYGGKIHNTKELQDLQNEVASLKRLIATLDDRQFEAMMAVEESEARLSQARSELQEIRGIQSEQNASLMGEKTKILSQIDRLDAERQATLPPIVATDLTLYEQLRKSRNGVAVVKISSRACTACGATLTAALVQTIQSTGQLIRCPTCGRILYPG